MTFSSLARSQCHNPVVLYEEVQELLLLRVELDDLQSRRHVHDPEEVLRPPDDVVLGPLYDLDALLELFLGDVFQLLGRLLYRRQFFVLHDILYGFDAKNTIN